MSVVPDLSEDKLIESHLSANRITTAVASFFQDMGDATLPEFTLSTGRRVDLLTLSRNQH